MPEPEQVLGQCVGKWQGTVKTWFEPGKLADESKVSGEIVTLLNGNFFRHTYEGSMKGRPRHGEETLAMNGITKKFQVCWFGSLCCHYSRPAESRRSKMKGYEHS
ncbi:MAG: DUF1579 family protein [Fuerstia sp.]|nr:DUF1579 family protein [Fuerstiella sp.]